MIEMEDAKESGEKGLCVQRFKCNLIFFRAQIFSTLIKCVTLDYIVNLWIHICKSVFQHLKCDFQSKTGKKSRRFYEKREVYWTEAPPGRTCTEQKLLLTWTFKCTTEEMKSRGAFWHSYMELMSHSRSPRRLESKPPLGFKSDVLWSPNRSSDNK